MSGIRKDITKKKNKDIDFVAIYNAVSEDDRSRKGLSGGDRILIELTKIWKNIFRSYKIITCSSGETIIRRYIKDFDNLKIGTIKTPSSYYRNILKLYLFKTIKSLIEIQRYRFRDETYLFSSSDFLPDVLPATFAKIKNKNIRWITAFYFFASIPFSSEFPYKGLKQSLRGVFYYLTQKIAYNLILKYADFVLLCNDIDKKIFVNAGFPAQKIFSIYGGVDLAEAHSVSQPKKNIYDAVFMARFHPQKGPMIAVKAWEEVLRHKKDSKLAMIGNGYQEREIKDYVREKKLEDHIKFVGFLYGVRKYQVLKSAKIFLHPSIYETGGMAAAEGMAAGLPVIAFDHKGFDYCYPKGIKRIAPIGDYKALAKGIIDLMNNHKEYISIKHDACELVKEWDWEKRAKILLSKIENI